MKGQILFLETEKERVGEGFRLLVCSLLFRLCESDRETCEKIRSMERTDQMLVALRASEKNTNL